MARSRNIGSPIVELVAIDCGIIVVIDCGIIVKTIAERSFIC